MTKQIPSLERGCIDKANLGRNYRKSSERLSRKHGKVYGVYRCPHCGGTHTTTKIEVASKYFAPLLYITGFTGCNTCPNLAECHKSGYCVEQIAKQQKQQ